MRIWILSKKTVFIKLDFKLIKKARIINNVSFFDLKGRFMLLRSQSGIFMNVFYYIMLELFWRYLFKYNFIDIKVYGQALRVLLILFSFLLVLFMNKTLTRNDFRVSNFNIILLLIFSILIIILIFSKNSIKLVIYFKAIFFAPVIEEIICRKLLLDNFNNIILSVIISSLIFTMFHFSFNIVQILYFFLIGVTFSFIQLETNNLLNVIALHSVINLFIVTLGGA